MDKDRKRPLISVIVPVYNGEDVIKRSVDSLLNQTYDNLEIIVIDDGSTDNTLQILEEYQRKWDGKIFVHHIENSGQGWARNIGIKYASGELLGFCDADDYYNKDGFEKMEAALYRQKVDLLYTPCLRENEQGVFRIGEIAPPYNKREIIKNMNIFGFYNLLVRKELCVELGEIPSMIYEDIAYVGALLTKADRIGYYPYPVYHYVNSPNSIVNSKRTPKILQFRDAIDWALAHASDEYMDELVIALALKCVEKIKSVRFYSDCFLEKLHTMRECIENNQYYKGKTHLYESLKGFLEMVGEPFPRIVYVDGVSQPISDEEIHEIERIAYREGAQVIVLTYEMCDLILEDKAAMAVYLGIRKILETGGIFIGNSIRVKDSFDCMRYHGAFFGYENYKLLTARVFGGQKSNEVLKQVYSVWSENVEKINCSIDLLAKILTEFLVSQYGLKLKGENTYIQYPFATLSSTVVTVDYEGNPFHICERFYREFSDDMQVVSPQLAKTLIEVPPLLLQRRLKNQKTKIASLEFKIKEQQAELDFYKRNGNNRIYILCTRLQKRKWGVFLLKAMNYLLR